jgi:hypothetical protein
MVFHIQKNEDAEVHFTLYKKPLFNKLKIIAIFLLFFFFLFINAYEEVYLK